MASITRQRFLMGLEATTVEISPHWHQVLPIPPKGVAVGAGSPKRLRASSEPGSMNTKITHIPHQRRRKNWLRRLN
jgi:hypothetical protein